MFRISLSAIIITTLAFFTLPDDAEAFPERERGWIFGVTGGATYMGVSDFPGNLSADPIVGFNAGISAERHLAQEIVFRPQLLFSQKGFAVEGEENETMYDYTFSSQYIDAIVPLIYSFELHSEFVPQVFVGASLSYGLDGSFEGDVGEEAFPEGFDDDLNFLDVGSVFGIGGIQHFRDFAMTIDLRYNIGFLDTGIHEEDSIRNQGFQLNLGFRF